MQQISLLFLWKYQFYILDKFLHFSWICFGLIIFSMHFYSVCEGLYLFRRNFEIPNYELVRFSTRRVSKEAMRSVSGICIFANSTLQFLKEANWK